MEHREHDGAERAPIGYVGIVEATNPTIEFNRAIAWLAPNASAARIAAQVFNNHVTRHAIAGWRKGRHRPPPWVREYLIARVYDRINVLQDVIVGLRAMSTWNVEAHGRTLTPARRAKEKARVAARAKGQTESETVSDKTSPAGE